MYLGNVFLYSGIKILVSIEIKKFLKRWLMKNFICVFVISKIVFNVFLVVCVFVRVKCVGVESILIIVMSFFIVFIEIWW